MTLAQYAQLEKQPLKKRVMLGLAMEGLIADIMSWRSTDGALSETGVRFDEVPTPDWVPLDGTISSKSANGKPIAWSVYELSMHIDIPKALDIANTNQLVRALDQQVTLATKGFAYVLNDTFINGDQASDANQFEGINKIVADLGSAQTVNSTEIDLTASYTDAIAESLFVALDQAIYATEGHMPSFAVANDTFLLKMESIGRQYKLRGDHFNWEDATFDIGDPRTTQRTKASKPAFKYRGIPFFDIGLKADQSTRIIGNTYTEGGSTAHGTRIFFVKLGEQDVEGIELSPLEVVDSASMSDGTIEDKNVRRKRMTHRPGLAVWGPRSIVKLQGVRAV